MSKSEKSKIRIRREKRAEESRGETEREKRRREEERKRIRKRKRQRKDIIRREKKEGEDRREKRGEKGEWRERREKRGERRKEGKREEKKKKRAREERGDKKEKRAWGKRPGRKTISVYFAPNRIDFKSSNRKLKLRTDVDLIAPANSLVDPANYYIPKYNINYAFKLQTKGHDTKPLFALSPIRSILSLPIKKIRELCNPFLKPFCVTVFFFSPNRSSHH